MSAEIVKTCSCGKAFTREQWEALPKVGLQTYDNGEVQEMRNCPCGSSIVIVLDPGETQEPAKGQRWKAKVATRGGHARIYVTSVESTGVSFKYVARRTRIFLGFEDFYKQFTPVRRTS